jgi:hypothetical protein
MSKVIPIDHGRAIRTALRKVHRAVVHDFALHADALKVLEMYIERLIEIAPPWRLAQLAHSVAYVTTELDLTLANINVVLICLQCLDEQYRAERRASA